MASSNRIAELRRRFAELPDLEDLERRVNRRVASPAIDAAVNDGRIASETCEDWLALAESDPDLTKAFIAGLKPSEHQAALNAASWSEEDEESFRREMAVAYGLKEDEIL